jgi:hypothetical protein
LEELRSTAIFGDFDRVVDADQACSAFCLFFDTIEVRERWVTAATVRVDNDRIGGVECCVIGRPAVTNYFDLGIRDGSFDGIGQDTATGVMFMGAEIVAATTGDENDFLRGGSGGSRFGGESRLQVSGEAAGSEPAAEGQTQQGENGVR